MYVFNKKKKRKMVNEMEIEEKSKTKFVNISIKTFSLCYEINDNNFCKQIQNVFFLSYMSKSSSYRFFLSSYNINVHHSICFSFRLIIYDM